MTERDVNGRFAKGNKGGPGRPPKERSERYYEIALTTCTYEDWKRILQKAVEQAKRGNPTARKWLADYLIGPPTQRHEHEGHIEVENVGLTDDERIARIVALSQAARTARDRTAS